MPGGVAGVAHFITVHEQTQSNRVCCFNFFGVLLAPQGSYYLALFRSLSISTTAVSHVPYLMLIYILWFTAFINSLKCVKFSFTVTKRDKVVVLSTITIVKIMTIRQQ